ncbi:MAG TPA: UDP-phosphate alpha N-acetylglucosaminyltransferase [Kaistia sp.]|nr:UDP-phosphate alpha N-acetylglucosaminyltransferase [Kaistia sp.]
MRSFATGRVDPAFGAFDADAIRDRIHQPAIVLILVGALVFNLLLCFVNTVVFRVTDTMVMGAEMVLISAAFALGVNRKVTLWLILGIFMSYMALLMALRPMLDLKAVRDFLIPITFYTLGRRYPDRRIADKAALISGVIVLFFGLFEYFFLDIYIKYFNIIAYYVARGTVAASDVTGESGLFASGLRPDARNILPFLGPHRVSSVFLEPVSAGNFGAILYMWALCRKDMRWRKTLFVLGAMPIILSDARFGLYVCVAATALSLVPFRLPRIAWYFLPMAVMLALAIYGFTSAEVDWRNDFGGRLLWTARLLTSLDIHGAFGISPDKPFLSDSGYAYTISEIGIFGVIGFWTLFIFGREDNPDAWRFKMLVATYICLLLLISDSPYSIKTAALLWFMVGTNDGFVPPMPPQLSIPNRFTRWRASAASAPQAG